MSNTINYDLITPTEGALDWHIPLNSNFVLIDSILQSIRTNYKESTLSTGPAFHNEVGSLWYSILENPGEGLFIKKSTGYTKLLDESYADNKYIKTLGDTLKGTLTIGSNGMLYFYNTTTFAFAKMLFQTYGSTQNLIFEFGASPESAIRFIGNTGTLKDILHVKMNNIKSFVPLEIPTATASAHAINKGQADANYATVVALNAALLRITELEARLNAL